jgi:hypothetical protein
MIIPAGLVCKRKFDESESFRKALSKLLKDPTLVGKSVVFYEGQVAIVSDDPEEAYIKGNEILGDTHWVVGQIA